MHATQEQRVISTSIPSNLIDCENCASERAGERAICAEQTGIHPAQSDTDWGHSMAKAQPEPLRRYVTPFVLHSGNLNCTLCIGLTSTCVYRPLHGIGMTRMKSSQSRKSGCERRAGGGGGAEDKGRDSTNVHVSIGLLSFAAAVTDRFDGDIRCLPSAYEGHVLLLPT